MDAASGTTVLTGTNRDRAQLHGYIERIEELGLVLVSVQQARETDLDRAEPDADEEARNT
jgi:hypothetical protein